MIILAAISDRSRLRRVARQIRLDQRCFWRHRQNAFFSFLLPVILLVVLGAMNGHTTYHGIRFVNWAVPGLLTFGIVAATYNNLAVTIITQREMGVLKRLRATPLSARTFIAGHIGSSLTISACLTAVFIAAARALFGITLPARHAPAFIITLAVGAGCLCALGLAVTPLVRSAEAAPAVINATYIPLALVSGVFFTPNAGPHWLHTLSSILPLRPFADALGASFSHQPGMAWRPAQLGILLAWATAASITAFRYFRWTPTR